MTDPRNVAHDKKVQQEKKHRGDDVAHGADETPQPGRKPHMEHHASDDVPAEGADTRNPPRTDEVGPAGERRNQSRISSRRLTLRAARVHAAPDSR